MYAVGVELNRPGGSQPLARRARARRISPVEKRSYLALVRREAHEVLNAPGEALRRALREARSPDSLGPELVGALEEQLKAALVEVDHLEDVLKHAESRDVPAGAWRGAETWQEVLTAAAMAALERDVFSRARDIVSGAIPRMENIQLY